MSVTATLGAERRAVQLEVIATPELAGVVPVRWPLGAEEAHPFVRDRHHLGAEQLLEPGVASYPTLDPTRGESASRRERAAVEFGDRSDHRVLHLGRDVDVDLAHPRLLLVAVVPLAGRVDQPVQLRPAMRHPGPHVGDRSAELCVPEQWRQVVEGDHHPDVVHRAVRERPNRPVGGRLAPEQPDIAGAGDAGRLVERHRCVLGRGHGAAYGSERCASGSGLVSQGSSGWPPSASRRAPRPCGASGASSSTHTRTSCAPACTLGSSKPSNVRRSEGVPPACWSCADAVVAPPPRHRSPTRRTFRS